MLFAFFIYSCSCHQNRSHCRDTYGAHITIWIYSYSFNISSQRHTRTTQNTLNVIEMRAAREQKCVVSKFCRHSENRRHSQNHSEWAKIENKETRNTPNLRRKSVRVRVIWFLMFEILIKSNWYEIVRACECMCAKTTPSGTRNRAINVCIHDMEFALKINYSRFGGVQFYNK